MSTPFARLHVQSLTQPLPPQDTDNPRAYEDKIERLAALVRDADAVVAGVGSGLSTAAGYDFYHASDAFDRTFGAFAGAHGFATLFDGMYHAFSTNEEQWAFNAAVIDHVEHLPVGTPYRQLARVLATKEHFVLTTNVDGQVPRAFGRDRVWLFQGDLRHLQCSQPCHEGLVRDPALIRHLFEVTRTGANGAPRVPTDELPRCPWCRRLMVPWVRDDTFLEGSLWHEQKAAYESFLERHLVREEGRVLFLELGVSSMTPAIIKLPFWNMVARNENAFYANINCADVSSPKQLGERTLVVTADLARVMADLADRLWARSGPVAGSPA